jgi:2-C-methyl-D-erythritol 4-phosphate cytidylyltransferase
LVLVDGAVVTLARAVAALPEEVEVVVELDAASLEAWDPRLLADLLGALGATTAADAGGRAAVTASAPMADALKRVDGERVVGGLARDGLHVPRLPRAYRRRALAQVSASWAAQDPHTDGALLDALRAAGAGVAMLLTDGTVVELDAAPVPTAEVAS